MPCFRRTCAVSLLASLALLTGCDRGPSFSSCDKNAAVNPWTHTTFQTGSRDFQFAIVADRTGGMRKGVFAEAVGKLNLLRPSFVMSVGDLIEGYSEDEAVINAEWAEFDSLVWQLDMPFFYLPGNHDISNPMMAAKWGQRFGRPYYHFMYGDVLFLCMNTEDSAATTITDRQLEYFEGVLRKHRTPRWTLVFMHKPMWQHKPDRWEQVKRLLSDRPHTIFAGHHHTYEYDIIDGTEYIKLAVTGGANELWGPREGKFDHVTWITMTDNGPRVANIALDGIHPRDIRSAALARRADSLGKLITIAATPLYVRRAGQDATSRVRVTNRSARPAVVEGLLAGGLGLSVCPGQFTRTVKPGASVSVDVTVGMERAEEASPVKPVELSCAVTLEGDSAAAVRRGLALAPAVVQRSEELRRTKVVVDGNLGEWRSDIIECKAPREVLRDRDSWSGPNDSRFAFAVAHDDDFLYVGVQVWDDTVYVDSASMPWETDGIEVRVDSRPGPARWTSAGAAEFDSVMLVAMSPSTSGIPTTVFAVDRLPKGTCYVCKTTDKGYVGEMAIPVSWLNKRRGGEWDSIRVNVAVDDFEGPGNGAQLWWQPSWRSRGNYAGSGTFVRK